MVYLDTNSALLRDKETISINRAVELVGVSRRTIYNWIQTNKVDYIRTAGGSIRIIKETLFRYGDDK